ncbi:hypothetical protein D3C87_1289680 [compost metagenome]
MALAGQALQHRAFLEVGRAQGLQTLLHRAGDGHAGDFIDDAEDLLERLAHRGVQAPAGELLGDGVHEGHAHHAVRADHRVANRAQGDVQPLLLLEQRAVQAALLGDVPVRADQRARHAAARGGACAGAAAVVTFVLILVVRNHGHGAHVAHLAGGAYHAVFGIEAMHAANRLAHLGADAAHVLGVQHGNPLRQRGRAQLHRGAVQRVHAGIPGDGGVGEIPFPDAHAAGFHGQFHAARQLFHAFVVQLAAVDVLHLGDVVVRVAGLLVAHHRHGQQRPAVAAVLVAVALFHAVGVDLAGGQALQLAQVGAQVVRVGDQLERGLAELFGRVPEQLAHGAVHQLPAPIQPNQRHADGGMLQRLAEALLAAAQVGAALAILRAHEGDAGREDRHQRGRDQQLVAGPDGCHPAERAQCQQPALQRPPPRGSRRWRGLEGVRGRLWRHVLCCRWLPLCIRRRSGIRRAPAQWSHPCPAYGAM